MYNFQYCDGRPKRNSNIMVECDKFMNSLTLQYSNSNVYYKTQGLRQGKIELNESATKL